MYRPATEAHRQQSNSQPLKTTQGGDIPPRGTLQQSRLRAPSLNQVHGHRLIPRYVLRLTAQAYQEAPIPLALGRQRYVSHHSGLPRRHLDHLVPKTYHFDGARRGSQHPGTWSLHAGAFSSWTVCPRLRAPRHNTEQKIHQTHHTRENHQMLNYENHEKPINLPQDSRFKI